MATKLRLQRQGRKKQAYYHIVAADARAPRDGRFIERIGDYNPNTNPATINLNLEKAVQWLDNGAIPTDTVKAILSYKGAMMLHHLHGGVRKGAFTAEQADEKFATWTQTKDSKVQGKRDNLANAKADAEAAKFKAETATKEAKAATIAARIAAEEAAKIAAENPVVEEVAEVIAEAPVAEVVTEVTEASVAETVAEVIETPIAEVVVEITEAPVTETVVEVIEAPVTEIVAEVTETPAADAPVEIPEA